jgi:hypothetical protein
MRGQPALLARGTRDDLRFDQTRGRGVVFHMLSCVEPLASVGVTAIADSAHGADDLYASVHTALARPIAKPQRMVSGHPEGPA